MQMFAPEAASASPHTAKPIITLNGVTKTYGNGTTALRDVDLAIGQSEFVSLLGPSGCGKSTLLRLIAGLGEISAGRIDWPQTAHTARGEPEHDIGFVFQEPTLMPWATVFDNVYLPLKLKRMSRRQAAPIIRDALTKVGLENFGKAYPRELSGGMKMRVSIARGLITRPSVLLMDEPFAALDEITRFRLNDDLLAMWAGQHWTVIFVTHSVYESVYLSDRIVVMGARPGRVTADIRIDEPYPRSEAFRLSSRYNDYCRLVSAALHETMT
ncbi:ABC transporter ATP-binding protein [Acidisoma cellulosilytica]|uniref:ABC transporter ATP-binding protein n=1 Tax=Acidisoma cellulosilyticum TaxID=2802395 RepID=A0A963Z2K9_9PROT|nr:ABC transporter ATP-binding protein [Acidisoma cellulosilyticum]MCB8881605.1 ABC transporter ATP-binding protein [Acidisoma cellulosilyticum]